MRRSRIVLALALTMVLAPMASRALATGPGTDGRIAFVSDRYRSTDNIFTMNPDGSDVHQLTFLTAAQGGADLESWSPDGTKLVFVERNADFSSWQIYTMNADGSNQRILFKDSSYFHFDPGFSPDGRRVVFARCRQDFEACAIYSVRSDGHGMAPITHLDVRHNVLDFSPEYSPDGRTIAFESFNRGGVTDAVYLMGVHGTDVSRLTPTWLEAEAPDWSPDGSRIVFSTNCCNPLHSSIWVIRADGTELRQLTLSGARHDFTPEYAPAGDRIAFERASPDFSTSRIEAMNPDGSGLTTIQPDARHAAWGPAG